MVGKDRPERRRNPRFIVGGVTRGRVTGVGEASLLNISLGGLLIEHAEVIRPGTISHLVFPLLWRVLRVRCRVIWSAITRQEYSLDGEDIMIYHTGLELIDPPEETRQVISDYIQSMIEEGLVKPSGDGQIRRSYECEECGESLDLTDSEVRPVFMDPRKRPVQVGDLFRFGHGSCQGTLKCTFAGPNVPWTVGEGA